MSNISLQAQDFRSILFDQSRNGFLSQFSRLQEIFDEYADRILRKTYINLSSEESKVLMTLSTHAELGFYELQELTDMDYAVLENTLRSMRTKGYVSYPSAHEAAGAEPVYRLTAAGSNVLGRMQRLLRKADEIMISNLREGRKTPILESVKTVVDGLELRAN